MKTISNRLALHTFAVLVCCTVMPAVAQDSTCQPLKIIDLWNSTQGLVQADAKLKDQDEGADPGDVEIDASKKSFLPLARFALNQLGFLSEDKNSFSVSQKINLGSSPLELNLQGKVQEPQIYEALKEALPEDGRQARADELLADLDESDDFALTLSSNLRFGNFGRVVDVYGDLFSTVLRSAPENSSLVGAVALADLISKITSEPNFPEDLDIDENTDLCTIKDGATRLKLKEAVVRAAKQESQASDALLAALKTTHLSEFYKLVDNQPQLHLTAAYRWRDPLLGPSGLSAKLAYEYGFANVNKFRKQAKRPDSPEKSEISLGDYTKYVLDPRTRAFLEHDDRISGSIEYVDDRKDRILLPEDGIDLAIGSGTSLKLTGTYGRSLDIASDLKVLSRVDVSLSYEDVSDDPQRQDRGLISVTYSARVRDPWFFTVVLNYANHAKFLPESDETFGAHVGVSYKLFSKDGDE